MANVYKPEDLGITPDETGGVWQQGAWYKSRQYWGGTLSEPGQIHPQSDQPGAGQPVSPEVIAQTDPANVAYIEQQQQEAAIAGVPPAATITPGGVPGEPGGVAPGAFQMPTQPTFDLPGFYEGLYAASGIKEKEAELSTKEKAFIEAKAMISDNPFLSEATRVGRVAKLEQLYHERTANLRGDIATAKADIETQLNLQLKQLDITSQATQLAWQQFNTLLSAGALDNASGEDIANLTRMTGISSSMIYSAIAANKKKNVNTQMITSTDESGEMFAIIINSDTGEVIKKTSLGMIGKAQQVGTVTERREEKETQIFTEVQQELDRLGGADKFVSPQEWQYLRQQWIMLGLSGKDFDDAFRTTYVGDPTTRDFTWEEFGLKE